VIEVRVLCQMSPVPASSIIVLYRLMITVEENHISCHKAKAKS